MFKDYLRRKKDEVGMSEAILAQCLDYSPQFVWNWLNGVSMPPKKIKTDLCILLDINPKEYDAEVLKEKQRKLKLKLEDLL